MARRWLAASLIAVVTAGGLSREARALDRDVRAVIVTGLYGAAGGTVLGLASYPITEEVRGIFMGTSIGLYLGIIAGFYFVTHRGEPGNPLRYGMAGTGRAGSARALAVQVSGVGGELLGYGTRLAGLAAWGPGSEGWTIVVRRYERELLKTRHTIAGRSCGSGFTLAYPVATF